MSQNILSICLRKWTQTMYRYVVWIDVEWKRIQSASYLEFIFRFYVQCMDNVTMWYRCTYNCIGYLVLVDIYTFAYASMVSSFMSMCQKFDFNASLNIWMPAIYLLLHILYVVSIYCTTFILFKSKAPGDSWAQAEDNSCPFKQLFCQSNMCDLIHTKLFLAPWQSRESRLFIFTPPTIGAHISYVMQCLDKTESRYKSKKKC